MIGRKIYAMAALAFGGMVGVALAGLSSASSHVGEQQSLSSGSRGTSAASEFALDPRSSGYCSRDAVIATIAVLRTGYSIDDVKAAGYDTTQLIATAAGAPAAGAEGLVVVSQGGTSEAATAAKMAALPALSLVAPLEARSSRASLHSCLYDLSDKPQAAALLRSAEAAAELHGFLSGVPAVKLALITDNPTDTAAGDVIVIMAVDGGITSTVSGPLGGELHALKAVVALERLDGSVISVGFGPWYGQH